MDGGESRFFNRELSWLEFNQRVLGEAADPTVPLLERLRFLAISASNLDEFTMVRVGSLQWLVGGGVTRPDPTGMSPEAQLSAVFKRMRRMIADQYALLQQELEPALAERGVRRLRIHELNDTQTRVLHDLFQQELFPILTPIAVTGPDDVPLLANQALCLCVRLAPVDPEGAARFAFLALGRGLKRFLAVPAPQGYAYVLLEDAVGGSIDRFFLGQAIQECVPFRITRNADLELQEDQASDLMEQMLEILDARRKGACVRLDVPSSASPVTVEFLRSTFAVPTDALFTLPGPLDLAALMQLADVPGFDDLRNPPWPPRPSPRIDLSESLFPQIAAKDVLLYHPYESFDPVIRLLEEAADDPDVLAIKQTLYRTSRNSPMIAALKRAARNGKAVTAVVELKARFDEARNIAWARDLERADVQVIYGVKGLKTHAKLLLIVRREPQGIQRYVHVGTGNYNESTSRLYVDASLMTCDNDIGVDATHFFNAITGYSQPQRFRKLEAAPLGMRDKLLEMIDLEIGFQRSGHKSLIMLKLNSLVDERMIQALYEASQAGVKVRLNVRGICCLRPGVPGVSENISVTSVIDRFLEHSRVLYFHHGGDERVFISSADWMPRNLDRRAELLAPVDDPEAREKLIHLLRMHLLDDVKSHRLQPDGSYTKLPESKRRNQLRSQFQLYTEASDAHLAATQFRPTMFEPHLPDDEE